MAKIKIYHNPRCTKSRQTLKLLEERDQDLQIIEYLKSPPDEATIRRLLKYLAVAPQAIVRKKEHQALGLPATDDPQELIRRMAEHPQIIERPIVVNGRKAAIGRPPEQVLEIL